MSFIFAVIMSCIALSIALVSLLVELNLRKLAVLLGIILTLSMTSWLGGMQLFEGIGVWFTFGNHFSEGFCILSAFAVAVAFFKRQRAKNKARFLDLGVGLSQPQFEERCVAYLKFNGWKISHRNTVSGLLYTRAEKLGVRFGIIFVSADHDCATLMTSIYNRQLTWLGKIIFVSYLKNKARNDVPLTQKWRTVHYKALADLDSYKF